MRSGKKIMFQRISYKEIGRKQVKGGVRRIIFDFEYKERVSGNPKYIAGGEYFEMALG